MALVQEFRGPQAVVRLADGRILTMPAEPLRKIGVAAQQRFVLVTIYSGRDVVDVRVERAAEARPKIEGRPMPKVYVREGLKVATRR